MKLNLKYEFLRKIQELSFVDEIWLFGSRARGDHKDRSDIDIAILCPNATDSDWQIIEDIINNADTLLKIDCIRFDKSRIDDKFYNNIIKDKKVIYMKDLQWKDNFYTLGDAINRLKEVIEHKDLDNIEFLRDATIQRFEFTIELFWKLLKKVLLHEKIDVTTPRDTLSKSYQFKLINDESLWLKMLDDCNNTSHAYKEHEAKIIFENIKIYLPVFESTYKSLKEKYKL